MDTGLAERQPYPIRTTLEHSRNVALSILGDTFAVHEVGTYLATAELLPLVVPECGPLLSRLTLLISATEIADLHGLTLPAAPTVSTVCPALETARVTLQDVLSADVFGWGRCDFEAALLEDAPRTPTSESELRILISPALGHLADADRQGTWPQDMRHYVSGILGHRKPAVSDASLIATVLERSLSEDLMATCGLAAFLRRNPAVAAELHGNTTRQLAQEFPDVLRSVPAS